MDLIYENFYAMRSVDKRRWEYQALKDSLQEHKLIAPIILREQGGRYEIIDGLQRFMCAKDLGWTEIDASVQERTDDESMLLQIIANAVDIPTKPCEYALQLRRILARNPGMTLRTLAGIVCKTPEWVGEQLELLRLPDKIQKYIDGGALKVQNAYVLARLPMSWHEEYLEQAITYTHEEFKQLVLPKYKEYTESVVSGRIDSETPFQPTACLRSLKSCMEGIDNADIAATMVVVGECKTLSDAFILGVKWAMQLDPESVVKQKAQVMARAVELRRDAARRRKARMARGREVKFNDDVPSFPFPIARDSDE